LAAARHTLQEHQIRHLPVEEAMVEDVFIVDPDAPVGEVVEQMIARKLGSAVVCRDERVIGVFTTIDALRALHELLESS
jgi:acetoin utilization protein AcuB